MGQFEEEPSRVARSVPDTRLPRFCKPQLSRQHNEKNNNSHAKKRLLDSVVDYRIYFSIFMPPEKEHLIFP
jgi:hypothetical protein